MSITGSPVCRMRMPLAEDERLSSTTGPVGMRVTPLTSSARILGRASAITESLDEGEEEPAACLPRTSTGGPESSDAVPDDADGLTDPLGELLGAISAAGVSSPLLTAARRIRGRSESSELELLELFAAAEDDEDDDDASSPPLDDALRNRGRSGSLSLELLPVELLLAEPEDDPSIDFDASVRSSGVPALNSDTFTAW
jgi:hypothetical protein